MLVMERTIPGGEDTLFWLWPSPTRFEVKSWVWTWYSESGRRLTCWCGVQAWRWSVGLLQHSWICLGFMERLEFSWKSGMACPPLTGTMLCELAVKIEKLNMLVLCYVMICSSFGGENVMWWTFLKSVFNHNHKYHKLQLLFVSHVCNDGISPVFSLHPQPPRETLPSVMAELGENSWRMRGYSYRETDVGNILYMVQLVLIQGLVLSLGFSKTRMTYNEHLTHISDKPRSCPLTAR